MTLQITLSERAKWHMARQFKCPECGGNAFGTTNASNWEIAQGHCNGWIRLGENWMRCRFVWDRSDDEKYFVLKPTDHDGQDHG